MFVTVCDTVAGGGGGGCGEGEGLFGWIVSRCGDNITWG